MANAGLGNYTFLTPKFSIKATNVYADAKGWLLRGHLQSTENKTLKSGSAQEPGQMIV
jgi:hypothetical protein